MTMNTSKANRSDRNRKAIVGVRKQYATTPTIVLDGVSFTPATIVQALQASIDAADATTAAAAAFHKGAAAAPTAATAVFHKAVAAEQAASFEADTVYKGLRTLVTSQFKTSPDTLAAFGFTLPARREPDAATVASGVEKNKATRTARHTMGKRQKAGIKGTVAGDAPVTTMTATAAPPPPVTPVK